MWEIYKEFHFSASHQLRNLPDDHQCARLHGHNYIMAIKIRSRSLDDVGFVIDYGELTFVKEVVDALDHRHLNDMFNFNPTSENVVREMYDKFYPILVERVGDDVEVGIGLSETPKTWAWYWGD